MIPKRVNGKGQVIILKFAKFLLIVSIIGCLTGGCNETVQVVKLPAVEELPVIEGLPDPFLRQNGSRVKTTADWEARREEIKALLLYYQYGH